MGIIGGRRNVCTAMAANTLEDIHVDRDGIHMLPEEKIKQTNDLQEECKQFLAKTSQFTEIVTEFIQTVDQKAKIIEQEKLRSIGLQNRCKGEQDSRKKQQSELAALVAEKRAELERLTVTYDSLLKVE